MCVCGYRTDLQCISDVCVCVGQAFGFGLLLGGERHHGPHNLRVGGATPLCIPGLHLPVHGDGVHARYTHIHTYVVMEYMPGTCQSGCTRVCLSVYPAVQGYVPLSRHIALSCVYRFSSLRLAVSNLLRRVGRAVWFAVVAFLPEGEVIQPNSVVCVYNILT